MRVSPSESQRVFALTILLGGVCGLVAVLFHLAILSAERWMQARIDDTSGGTFLAATLLVPALGGAIAGVVLQRFVPGAAGSGIPQVKVAYSTDAKGLGLRDAIGKFAVCVLQLGTGASLGREGPTVYICAAVAARMGRWFALSPANLRRLIPVGSAAGIAAAFNAPIAAVTFTIEEIVGTLDQTVLSGVVAAAALAAVVEHSLLGTHPIFVTPTESGLHHASSLVVYALLGIAAAFVSVLFVDLLLGVRERFRRSPLPAWVRPAVGGLGTGGLAVAGFFLVHQRGALTSGSPALSQALQGEHTIAVLAVLAVLKLLATVSSYSSGGAGGIFAPTLFIGSMLGGVFGYLDVALFGHDPASELPSFALVGMGALFAGVIRAPMTSVLIVFEMTGGYELVLPLMIANAAAYVVARRMRPLPIYEALLAQDGIVLPHGTAARGALASIEVRDAMTHDLVTLPASMSLEEAAEYVGRYGHSTYPVLDEKGGFMGLLSEARLVRTIAEGGDLRTVGEVARRKEYALPDESLLRAVARMTRLGVRQLPVIARRSGELVGLLSMADVMRAQIRSAEREGSLSDETSLVDALAEPSETDRTSSSPYAPTVQNTTPNSSGRSAPTPPSPRNPE